MPTKASSKSQAALLNCLLSFIAQHSINNHQHFNQHREYIGTSVLVFRVRTGISRTTDLLKFAFIVRVSTCTVASCGPYPYSTCLTLLFFANTVRNKTGFSCVWSIVKNCYETRRYVKHVRRPGYGRWYPSVLLMGTLRLKLLEIVRISGITFKRSSFVFILSIFCAIIDTNSKRCKIFFQCTVSTQ